MNTPAELILRWVRFCEAHAVAVLAGVLALSVVMALIVYSGFRLDSDLGHLVRPSKSLPWHEANERFKASFPELQQTALVVLSGTEPGPLERSAKRLAAALDESGQFEFVFAPALDPFLGSHRAYYLDVNTLDAWVRGVRFDYGALLRVAEDATLANATFTLADQVAGTDGLRLPTLLDSLVQAFQAGVPDAFDLEAWPHLVPEADVHYVILMLKGEQRLAERLPNAAQVSTIRSTIAGTEIDPGVQVRLTGEVALAHEEIGMALEGIGIAGTLSLVFLGLILRFGVRTPGVIVATFLLLGVGALWTLGFGVLAVGAFNTLALIFVVMFFGLGVDFAVHYSLRLEEAEATRAGPEERDRAIREVGPALLLCMLTSSVAFLAFAPTDYRGLAELGIISAGGMVIAFLLTLSFLPAFYGRFGLPAEQRAAWTRPLEAWLARAQRLAPGRVLLFAGVIALVGMFLARDVRFDFSVLALRDAETEAMSTLLELQAAGEVTDYSVQVLADNAIDAERLRARFKRRPEIGDVMVPADLVPAGQREKAARLEGLADLVAGIGPVQAAEESTIEALREALSYLREVVGQAQSSDQPRIERYVDGLTALLADPERLMRLDAALARALSEELSDLVAVVSAEPFSFADLPVDLKKRLIAPDGSHLLTVQPKHSIRSREEMEQFVQAAMTVTPWVAGRAVVEWGVGEVVVDAFVQALSMAVTAIVVFLVLYFRGVYLPLVVLTPLALTSVICFAAIAMTPMTLNMANILVIPLIFGLGVDAGIHVVNRYAASGDVRNMLGSSTARAVVISALTTIGTFFSLSFSPHPGAASIGTLLTIAISVMLLVTFLVVPALLRLGPDPRPSRRSSPAGLSGASAGSAR